ncbi:MAG: ABC transporter permease [Proteobacteria bacterium]|nr:ABC transporter permease [Pseudomonadota bacterium]
MSIRTAVDDLSSGLKIYHIWIMLAWSEIKQRYRRSVIGPFWLTLSTAIMILAMGPLYGGLFGQSLNKYFLYLATSIIVWGLISSSINDACQVFIGSEGFIKQSSLPLSVYVLRLVWRNLIIFLHNVVVIIGVAIFYPPDINLSTLLVVPGLMILALNALWIGIVIGLVCARYRDVTQIVSSLVGIAFFITPVMWYPRMLGAKEWMVNLNPLYHFMQILRAPILGEPVALINWITAVAVTLLGFMLMIVLFGRYRSRIAYWV